MAKILIAEDDKEIALLEQDYLEINGYETEVVSRGDEVCGRVMQGGFDLILLDLMLPGIDGYEICRLIRDEVNIPILMVTARSQSVDKVRGLGLGADDYIPKPFDPAELVARVKSHLARFARLTAGGDEAAAPQRTEIRLGELLILPESWKALRGEEEIRFPNREFELLLFLAENPNIVFSKDRLFERIWGYDYVGDSATVTVHINRIRENIEVDPKKPSIIETVWGVGYRLNLETRA